MAVNTKVGEVYELEVLRHQSVTIQFEIEEDGQDPEAEIHDRISEDMWFTTLQEAVSCEGVTCGGEV